MVIIEPSVMLTRVGEAMNLLNEVAERHPGAISLAAGRPASSAARLGGLDDAIERAPITGDRLWQYGPTAGLLTDWVSEALAEDEGIAVDGAEVMLTTGAQEAMFLVLAALFEPGDVLLVPDPIYVGITGAAAVARVPVVPIAADPLDPLRLEAVVEGLAARGSRARALYLVPDFQNPLGHTLDLERRRGLLGVARRHGLLVIEDSPYRIFAYGEPPPPTLAALDERQGCVIHVGSFSKALSPGLRLGFVAWPGGDARDLARLCRAKSFVTVNTSPLVQAIAAGSVLPGPGGGPSLRLTAEPARRGYRIRRDALLAGLAGASGVRYVRPEGGFFLRVDLPFDFDEQTMGRCARTHGVLVCPMSMFSPTGGWRRTVRLSFSAADPAQLEEGARRFAAFVEQAAERST